MTKKHYASLKWGHLSFKPTEIVIDYMLTYFSEDSARRQLTLYSRRGLGNNVAKQLAENGKERRELIEETLQAAESKIVVLLFFFALFVLIFLMTACTKKVNLLQVQNWLS